MVQRQLEDELGRRRYPQFPPGKRRHHVEVFLDRLEDGVRIQPHIPHHLGEHVPLHLRKCEEQVLVRQQRVLATAGLLDGAVDDALRGFGDLTGRNVEIFYVHRILRRRQRQQTVRQRLTVAFRPQFSVTLTQRWLRSAWIRSAVGG